MWNEGSLLHLEENDTAIPQRRGAFFGLRKKTTQPYPRGGEPFLDLGKKTKTTQPYLRGGEPFWT
jgi:hypothetical protein